MAVFDGAPAIGHAAWPVGSTGSAGVNEGDIVSRKTPLTKRVLRRVKSTLKPPPKFDNSANYWEERYRTGGNSGAGSYNRLAQFKAEFLNEFVATHQIQTVIEFGSGDGAQLELAAYPTYVGVDVSPTAIKSTRRRFSGDASKTFLHTSEVNSHQAELALSLDVIYHLVEDQVFDTYMRQLFDAATRYVIVYSSNQDKPGPSLHVRFRQFTPWVEENTDFQLADVIPNRFPYSDEDPDNTSFADFFVFARRQEPTNALEAKRV
jgi:hypothetical protein